MWFVWFKALWEMWDRRNIVARSPRCECEDNNSKSGDSCSQCYTPLSRQPQYLPEFTFSSLDSFVIDCYYLLLFNKTLFLQKQKFYLCMWDSSIVLLCLIWTYSDQWKLQTRVSMWPKLLDLPAEQCKGMLRNLGKNVSLVMEQCWAVMLCFRVPGLHQLGGRLPRGRGLDGGEEVEPRERGGPAQHLRLQTQGGGEEGG